MLRLLAREEMRLEVSDGESDWLCLLVSIGSIGSIESLLVLVYEMEVEDGMEMSARWDSSKPKVRLGSQQPRRVDIYSMCRYVSEVGVSPNRKHPTQSSGRRQIGQLRLCFQR